MHQSSSMSEMNAKCVFFRLKTGIATPWSNNTLHHHRATWTNEHSFRASPVKLLMWARAEQLSFRFCQAMDPHDTPSLAQVPIELVYRILDRLPSVDIIFNFYNVCTRLNAIIDSYTGIQVKTFDSSLWLRMLMRRNFVVFVCQQMDTGREWSKRTVDRVDTMARETPEISSIDPQPSQFNTVTKTN